MIELGINYSFIVYRPAFICGFSLILSLLESSVQGKVSRFSVYNITDCVLLVPPDGQMM